KTASSEWRIARRSAGRAPFAIRNSLFARSYGEVDIDRNVIGGFLPGSDMLVDADVREPVRRLRREQQMVDADAVVLLPGARLIIPERENAPLVIGGAQGVGEAEVEQRVKLGARLRQEQRVIRPRRRIAGVARRRNDVEIARQDERLFQRHAFARIMK